MTPKDAMARKLEETWLVVRWLMLLWIVGLTGCGGCFSSSTEKLSKEELEKRAKEQRESLEMGALVSIPADSEAKFVVAKPGHWVETRKRFKSNREDLQIVAVNGMTRSSKPVTIPGTNFSNEFTRRTSLPKGQTKDIDLQCFVPHSAVIEDEMAMANSRLTFQTSLLSWPLMTPILQAPSIKSADELREHEFQLVVLGPNALGYSYLSVLDTVLWSGDELMGSEKVRSYKVTLVKPENNKFSFPKSMLTMTAMAVLVWDDVDPDALSDDQKRAIVDWLHWGGQLVISGPSSWARLQNSFLSPYIPARSANANDLNTADFKAISATWKAEDKNQANPYQPISILGDPVGGVRFVLREGAQWLPGSGELVAEAQVGRGRIAMTSFPLTDPRIFRWPYYSNFFSTGLLRRHPRTIALTQAERLPAQFFMPPFNNSERDARLHSNVRILTRDLPLSRAKTENVSGDALAGQGGDAFRRVAENQLNTPSDHEAMQWGGRGAAWNDYSGMSFQALAALKAAAGIELPSRKTIMYMLGGYLLLLVPANWLFFRLIGRLEFAWVVAPIMAIAGALIVTKIARLDIGFARRTTEVSVLELHGSHDRGHLTQYIALYTSLSTNYAIQFPENDSVALPLGDFSRTRRRAGSNQRELRTNYGRADGVTLEPLTVYSSSTEMLHAEQMVGLEGGLRLGTRNADGTGAEALKNETGIDLSSALVLRSDSEGQLSMAWIGELAKAQTASLSFTALDGATDSIWTEWNKNEVTRLQAPTAEEERDLDSLWLGGVLKAVVTKTPLMPGQTRLFAYTQTRLGRLKVVPAEDQYDGSCLIVAHLTPKKLGPVKTDRSIRSVGKSYRSTMEALERAVQGELKSSPEDEDSGASDETKPATTDEAKEEAEAEANSDDKTEKPSGETSAGASGPSASGTEANNLNSSDDPKNE